MIRRLLGRSATKGVNVGRSVIGGLNLSVIGNQLPASEYNILRSQMERLGAQYPEVASRIDKVQVVNTKRGIIGGDFDGLANDRGNLRLSRRAMETEGWPDVTSNAWGLERNRSRILLDATNIRNSNAPSGFSVGRSGEPAGLADVFTHEFGHHVETYLHKGATSAKRIRAGRGPLLPQEVEYGIKERLFDPTFSPEQTRDMMARVLDSEYARVNDSELFAEMFAASHIPGLAKTADEATAYGRIGSIISDAVRGRISVPDDYVPTAARQIAAGERNMIADAMRLSVGGHQKFSSARHGLATRSSAPVAFPDNTRYSQR